MTVAARPRLVTVALAGLSAGAGVAHASVVAEHTAVAWWYGAGFGAVAFLQLAWAVLLLRRAPSWRVLAAGAAGHAVALGIWVLARTAGLPFVPDSPSAIGWLDGTTAAFEVLIALGVLATAGATLRLHPRLGQAVTATAAVVLVLTAPVTVGALAANPGHEHPPGPTVNVVRESELWGSPAPRGVQPPAGGHPHEPWGSPAPRGAQPPAADHEHDAPHTHENGVGS